MAGPGAGQPAAPAGQGRGRGEQLRRRWARALDPELRRETGLSPLNRGIVALILLSVLAAILETEPTLRDPLGPAFAVAETVFVALFAAEYLARAWTATVNPRWPSLRGYLVSPVALFDLAVIVGGLLPFFGLEANLLRLVRAFRLVRLARLGRFSRAMRLIGTALASRGPELLVSLGLLSGLLLAASTGLYLAEGGVQPEAFGSIPRAMWWAVATLTTVGYGDFVPVTGLGRVMAAVTALTGVAVIAVPTGLIAAAFADAMRAARSHHRPRPAGDAGGPGAGEGAEPGGGRSAAGREGEAEGPDGAPRG